MSANTFQGGSAVFGNADGTLTLKGTGVKYEAPIYPLPSNSVGSIVAVQYTALSLAVVDFGQPNYPTTLQKTLPVEKGVYIMSSQFLLTGQNAGSMLYFAPAISAYSSSVVPLGCIIAPYTNSQQFTSGSDDTGNLSMMTTIVVVTQANPVILLTLGYNSNDASGATFSNTSGFSLTKIA